MLVVGMKSLYPNLLKKFKKVIDFKGKIEFDNTKDGNPRKLLTLANCLIMDGNLK